ncbi:MAG: hypothetical protein KF832_09730 [Caldilineaceae bacterium]|nr:hypothetical protein [Caldilineaceae bacterium]
MSSATTPLRIAAIVTEYRRFSHADVIITKFLKGFPTDTGLQPARVQIASLYVDQFPETDLSRRYAAHFQVPIYNSIPKALTLGGDKLAVDGVLLIGEHGDYAWNEKEQHLYPRKPFMEQICGILATSGRAVPIFSDKHLSYNWPDAKWMYDRAATLGAPFMAGSSLPVGWRNPWLEHEVETPLQEALAIGYAGLDSYGFHALETLQCMIERRVGGEAGVAAVTCLEGDAVWQAGAEGHWSYELATAAVAAIQDKPAGALETLFGEKPAVFLLEHRDGFRSTVLMSTGEADTLQCFAYAARVQETIQACEVYLPPDPHPHFSYLSLNVEEMFVTGKPTWPVERTLLTTGVLEAALDSRYQGHRRVETPHLEIAYASYTTVPWRPTGPRPVGAALQPLELHIAEE